MIDLKYKELSGAYNLPRIGKRVNRARAVWDDGKMHLWTKDKRYFEFECSIPQVVERKKGKPYVHTVIIAGAGEVRLKRQCGCGMPFSIRMTRNAKRLLAKVK